LREAKEVERVHAKRDHAAGLGSLVHHRRNDLSDIGQRKGEEAMKMKPKTVKKPVRKPVKK
jgi:hypothetical protein